MGGIPTINLMGGGLWHCYTNTIQISTEHIGSKITTIINHYNHLPTYYCNCNIYQTLSYNYYRIYNQTLSNIIKKIPLQPLQPPCSPLPHASARRPRHPVVCGSHSKDDNKAGANKFGLIKVDVSIGWCIYRLMYLISMVYGWCIYSYMGL